MNRWAASLVGVLCVVTSACSSAKPVLYPNPHLQSVGKEVAEQDINACKQLAESAGAEEASGKGSRVATSTAVGAGGSGSIIGAASGAVWGLLTGIFYAFAGSPQPNQAYANFVNRCLQEKGYEVTGWTG
jgi:hypothetical protein